MVGRQGRRLKNAMDCGVRSTCSVHEVHALSRSDNLLSFYKMFVAKATPTKIVHAAHNPSGRRPCLSAMAHAPICRYSIATLTTLSFVT
jgi:hypothetical protein